MVTRGNDLVPLFGFPSVILSFLAPASVLTLYTYARTVTIQILFVLLEYLVITGALFPSFEMQAGTKDVGK